MRVPTERQTTRTSRDVYVTSELRATEGQNLRVESTQVALEVHAKDAAPVAKGDNLRVVSERFCRSIADRLEVATRKLEAARASLARAELALKTEKTTQEKQRLQDKTYSKMIKDGYKTTGKPVAGESATKGLASYKDALGIPDQVELSELVRDVVTKEASVERATREVSGARESFDRSRDFCERGFDKLR